MHYKNGDFATYNGVKVMVVGRFVVKGEIESYMIKHDGKIIINVPVSQLS